MNLLDQIATRAARHRARIVLSEGEDARVLQAAVRATGHGIAQITLVGNAAAIRQRAEDLGLDLGDINIVDPATSELAAELAQTLVDLRSHKGMTPEQARKDTLDPLRFADLMVRNGHADGSVAGAVYTTADVVRTALQIIGKAPDSALVSSFFLMLFDKPHHPVQGGMIFSDCGLVIDPDAEELASIALAAASSARHLLDQTPRVAMLSFSTSGSARHAHTKKVIDAARLAKEQCPELAIDEDVQLDAAIIPEIAARKLPSSNVQGRANVLVFPDLDAGNIGYKIAERMGGATAIGPLLQGLNKPANDLSRGCSADDIYYVIAVTAVQAAAAEVMENA